MRASAGALAVHSALIPCVCVCVCVCVCACACLRVRYQTPFSSRHESGPSLFLSTGKHPVGGQLPRVFSLLCLGRAATVQTYHPTKNFRFFSFLSPVFGDQPPKHAVD